MAWITTLLQFLPALMAAFSQLAPLIQAIINAINHPKAQALATAAGQPIPEWMWWAYVPGQTLAGTAGAAVILALQPRMNAMARAWHDSEAARNCALNQILNAREKAAKAYQLRAELSALAPEHQAIVTGK